LSRPRANEKTGKPLAPKTIRHYLSFISCVYTHAVDMRIMSESPCKGVKVLKIKRQEKEIYSDTELKTFLTDTPKTEASRRTVHHVSKVKSL
jgi:hypothetical protein